MNKNQEEMKNTLEGINTRLDKAEDWMSKLEDKVNKHLVRATTWKRLRKNKDSLRELQDNMKHNNIHITGIPEGENEQGIENLFEKMTENFPNFVSGKKVT